MVSAYYMNINTHFLLIIENSEDMRLNLYNVYYDVNITSINITCYDNGMC